LLNQVMLTQEDGKFILDNGKHWVQALVQTWRNNKPAGALSLEEATWAEQGLSFLNVELYHALTEGLLVDFVYYNVEAGEERTAQICIQCYSHEVEQNRFQPSTLANKVAVMTRLFNESNKDWSAVKKAMLDILGQSKAATVSR
jgi:hypothetical protein